MRYCLTLLLLIGMLQAAQSVEWYVATNGTGLGTNGWAYATNNLQGLITNPLVIAGDTIWVSNGVYDSGGITNYPTGSDQTTRVVITKAITLRSQDNDPTNTIIKGAWHPGTTNGASAVRCVYMAANSTLIGFTLTNGATFSTDTTLNSGGGVYCPSITTPVISNCIITGNSGFYRGGGVNYGTLRNCTLIGNFAWRASSGGGGAVYSIVTNCTFIGNYVFYGDSISGGGAYGCTIYNSTFISNKTLLGNTHGGGASASTLYNCTLIGNSSLSKGGGACISQLYNCTLIGNTAANGGGAYGDAFGNFDLYKMFNCTLVGNTAASGGGAMYMSLFNCTVVSNTGNYSYSDGGGGGVNRCAVYNSIVYTNYGPANGNTNWLLSFFTNSCTVPATNNWAVGNITADPMFVNRSAGNYRLAAGSPCINAGTNFSWMTNSADVRSKDMDNRQRLRYGTVDMGAYEHINAGTIYDVH